MKELPEIEGSDFCLSVLRSLGVAVMGYAAIEPLPWTEISAYQSATGVRLTAWEAETVRILSEQYVAQVRASDDENCPAPYTPEMTPAMKKAHAKLLRQKLRGK